MEDKSMVDKKEIVVRVMVFSVVYVLVAVLVLSYLKVEWVIVPVLIVIVVWGAYVYRMNVKVLGMPARIMSIEGMEGKALTDISDTGKIKVRGEIWNAQTSNLIRKGEKVRVLRREGIVLEVEPVED
jgi:membrane protein implicated in regulation of membrane protease activity